LLFIAELISIAVPAANKVHSLSQINKLLWFCRASHTMHAIHQLPLPLEEQSQDNNSKRIAGFLTYTILVFVSQEWNQKKDYTKYIAFRTWGLHNATHKL